MLTGRLAPGNWRETHLLHTLGAKMFPTAGSASASRIRRRMFCARPTVVLYVGGSRRVIPGDSASRSLRSPDLGSFSLSAQTFCARFGRTFCAQRIVVAITGPAAGIEPDCVV